MKVEVDGEKFSASWILCTNSKYYAGPYSITQKTNIFDKKVIVYIVKNLTRFKILNYLWLIYIKGDISSAKSVITNSSDAGAQVNAEAAYIQVERGEAPRRRDLGGPAQHLGVGATELEDDGLPSGRSRTAQHFENQRHGQVCAICARTLRLSATPQTWRSRQETH